MHLRRQKHLSLYDVKRRHVSGLRAPISSKRADIQHVNQHKTSSINKYESPPVKAGFRAARVDRKRVSPRLEIGRSDSGHAL